MEGQQGTGRVYKVEQGGGKREGGGKRREQKRQQTDSRGGGIGRQTVLLVWGKEARCEDQMTANTEGEYERGGKKE